MSTSQQSTCTDIMKRHIGESSHDVFLSAVQASRRLLELIFLGKNEHLIQLSELLPYVQYLNVAEEFGCQLFTEECQKQRLLSQEIENLKREVGILEERLKTMQIVKRFAENQTKIS